MPLANRFTQSKRLLREFFSEAQVDLINLWRKVWRSREISHDRFILFVDDMLPIPTFGAGYPRAAEIVHALSACGWKVALYPMYAESEHYKEAETQFQSNVSLLPSSGTEGLLRLLRTRGSDFSAVLISRPGPMKAFSEIVAARPELGRVTACIYDAEALLACREVLRRRVFDIPMSDEGERKAIKEELDLASPAHAVWAVTAFEAAQFERHLGVPAFVVSHGTSIRTDAPGVAGRQDFLFVGRLTGDPTYSPNVDSLIWFVEQVMPALDNMVGNTYRLRAVGLTDQLIRERIKSDRVVFEGVVQDTTPLYDSCRVFVAPTRFSAGLSLKVCETLAMGLPCASTDQLREQAELVSDWDILSESSHDPEAFATVCARLYVDDTLWCKLQEQGLSTMRARFSTEVFRKSVVAGLGSLNS